MLYFRWENIFVFPTVCIHCWHFITFFPERFESVVRVTQEPQQHLETGTQNQTVEILLQPLRYFSADTQRALEAVGRLQAKLKERGEAPTQEKLSLLKTVLQSPLFHHILSLQQAKRKPLAKVQHEHECVGVRCILNGWGRSRNRSQNTECGSQTGWVISLPKLTTKALRKSKRGREGAWRREGKEEVAMCHVEEFAEVICTIVISVKLKCVCVWSRCNPCCGDLHLFTTSWGLVSS